MLHDLVAFHSNNGNLIVAVRKGIGYWPWSDTKMPIMLHWGEAQVSVIVVVASTSPCCYSTDASAIVMWLTSSPSSYEDELVSKLPLENGARGPMADDR